MASVQRKADRLFKCELPRAAAQRLGDVFSSRATATLERLLAMDRLNRLYDRASAGRTASRDEFLDSCLDQIGARCHVRADDLARIPKTGPVIIVANHPFGALEGVMLASMLGKVRPDFRIMVNFLLERIPELRDIFLFVDPFGGEAAAAKSMRGLRQAIRFVKDGGLLAVFPAGEVSHLRLSERQISDPAWNETAARIIRITAAPVLPVYFDGANTPLFQLLGLVHSRLRTAMLIREVFTKRGQRVDVRVGSSIPPRRLLSFDDDRAMTEYLRQRTYLLRYRPVEKRKTASPLNQSAMEQIPPPQNPAALQAEVAGLPADQRLVESGEFAVYFAKASQIPCLLQDIGRLRELTFRLTGEGTGKAVDIDTFDYDYLHLFAWCRKAGEIVGGYRIGQTDLILADKGPQGLYTSTLVDYRPELLRRLTPALELGRSFVAPQHQKAYAPLMMLWKGIGQFILRNPHYRHLYGPVSISKTYQSVSRQLMVRFLRLHHGGKMEKLVTPHNPFRDRRIDGWDDKAVRALLHDGEDLSELVSEIEPDQKGIPVLLRQYLKFGAHLLAINVDPDFSDVIDGLLMADLTKAPRRVLEKYMGREGLERYLAFHAAT